MQLPLHSLPPLVLTCEHSEALRWYCLFIGVMKSVFNPSIFTSLIYFCSILFVVCELGCLNLIHHLQWASRGCCRRSVFPQGQRLGCDPICHSIPSYRSSQSVTLF